MNIRIQKDIDDFIQEIKETNPSILVACQQIIEEFKKSDVDEIADGKIKKLARARTEAYRRNKHNGALLSNGILVSELAHGEMNEEG